MLREQCTLHEQLGVRACSALVSPLIDLQRAWLPAPCLKYLCMIVLLFFSPPGLEIVLSGCVEPHRSFSDTLVVLFSTTF